MLAQVVSQDLYKVHDEITLDCVNVTQFIYGAPMYEFELRPLRINELRPPPFTKIRRFTVMPLLKYVMFTNFGISNE